MSTFELINDLIIKNDINQLEDILNENNVNILNDRYETFLHTAISNNCKIDIIKLLINKGININDNSNLDNISVLHLAVETIQEPIVKLLIEYDIDLELKTYNYETALHKACLLNLFNIVKILIEVGANINAENDYGILPINLTSSKRITKYLLKNGSYINNSELTLDDII